VNLETMVYWEGAHTSSHQPAMTRDFAEIWRAADKIVHSRRLRTPSSERTRIERDFGPGAIRRLKESSAPDMTIGGAQLAGQAIAAGRVDECHLFLGPLMVGGGKPALPDDVRVQLELLAQGRFRSGVVHLHCRLRV
jgi:dihydrofolate reductase